MLLHLDVVFIDEAGNALKELLRKPEGLPVKHHQVDQHFVFHEEFADGVHGDLQCQRRGKAVITRRNERKRHRLARMLSCQLETALIAGAQQLFFIETAALPHRADGVDHIGRIQVIGAGNGGVSHLDLADFLPCREQPETGSAVHRGVHAAANGGPGIGGVHNRVHLHIGNVVSYNFKWQICSPAFFQNELFIHHIKNLKTSQCVLSLTSGWGDGIICP